jgi:hypothetical protein
MRRDQKPNINKNNKQRGSCRNSTNNRSCRTRPSSLNGRAILNL